MYYNPVNVIFSNAPECRVESLLSKRKASILTTPGMLNRTPFIKMREFLKRRIGSVITDVRPNPDFESILACNKQLQHDQSDVVIAFGGGSVIDTAKAAVALLEVSDPSAWLKSELAKGEMPENFSPIPIIAIPTTAGTGSEVTKWGTIWEGGVKFSIADDKLYPSHAIITPEHTYTLSYEQSLFPALDALSQAMEAIWNKNSNAVSDELAVKAISILHRTLSSNYKSNFNNKNVRRSVQYASVVSGLAFSNTQTALAHSISYPLTGHFNMPHGLACSFTLPQILEFNLSDNRSRAKLIIEAFESDSIESVMNKINVMFHKTGVSSYVNRYVKKISEFQKLKNDYLDPSRAKNNIKVPAVENVMAILEKSFEVGGIR